MKKSSLFVISGVKMKLKAGELHGKTVEEIEKILTDKLTPEEREKMKQIEEMFERER